MKNTRREFLMATGGVMAASSLLGAPLSTAAAAPNGRPETAPGTVGGHTLPALPYAYDALAPHIDEETMRLHHSRHHQTYVDGLNAAEKALAKAREEGDFAYVQHWQKQQAFHGAGHALHVLFWKVMAPAGEGGAPSGALGRRIAASFGSIDAFKAAFSAASRTVEGNGWGILAYRWSDGALVVLQAENHQKLTTWDAAPILCLDVWEHAYYISYRNRRADYVDAWWNVVNWEQVSQHFDGLEQARPSLIGAGLF